MSGDDGGSAPGEFTARLATLSRGCETPGRLLLVTGPIGSGKSELCEALLDDLDPSCCAVSVSARRDEPYAFLLAAILEAYGFKVEPGTSVHVMSDLIAHHAGDPDAPGRRCVVVVDDADGLPLRELQALVALLVGSALTLVLAGPTQIVPAVRLLAEQVAVDLEHVELGAGASQRAPASGQDRDLPRAARGRASRSASGPGTAGMRLLGAGLTAAGAAPGAQTGPFGFPMRHLVLLGGLVLVLLVVYIVGQVAEEVTESAVSMQRVETLTMPPLETPEPEAAPGTLPAPGASVRSPARDSAAAPAVSDQLELPTPAAAEAGETTPAEAAAPRPIISRPGPTTATGAAPETPAPGVSATAPRPVPAAAEARAPAAAPAGAAGGSPRGASWIMEQPAASHTVQLVSLSSAERARAYIAQQPDPGAFATYRLMRNGQLFHVVVYGKFTSKTQADQAAANLPASVGNIQPWVRTFGQVQEAIRTTPGQ